MKYLQFLLFLAIISCSFSFKNDEITDFVKRQGNQLYLDGEQFRFSGANIYWLGLDENVFGLDQSKYQYPTQWRIEDALQTAVEMGVNVVRAHTLGVSTGGLKSFEISRHEFNNDAIGQIMYAIQQCRKHGIRLIIPLTDNWDYYHGGKIDFVRWQNYTGDQLDSCNLPEANFPDQAKNCAFYYEEDVIFLFKNYVSMLLNHIDDETGIPLKYDPVVMAWETGNELVGAGSNWTQNIADFIKNELGAKQLIMDGRSCAREGVDPNLEYMDNVDMVDWHFYGMYPLNASHVNDTAGQVKAVDKVYVIGEYGWSMNGADDLKSFLDTIEINDAVGGDLYWSLFPHNDYYGYVYHQDGFTMNYPGHDDDSTTRIAMLRNHSFNMRNVDVPAPSIPISAPIITYLESGCIAWRGSSLAGTYSVEVSWDKINWETICDQCWTDSNGPWWDPHFAGVNYWYRILAHSVDGTPGEYSNPKKSGWGFPIVCFQHEGPGPQINYRT